MRGECARGGRVHCADGRWGGQRQPHGAPHHDQRLHNRLRREGRAIQLYILHGSNKKENILHLTFYANQTIRYMSF